MARSILEEHPKQFIGAALASGFLGGMYFWNLPKEAKAR
jgi:hypothetical protein